MISCLRNSVFALAKLWLLWFLWGPLCLFGLDNGVGLRPSMGWNSWNFFRCDINESLVKEVADAMVSSGLKAAGYQYVILDDCWQEKRGPDNKIIPFKTKFPSGMKALADYVHAKGLKFGIYSDAGHKTCEGYPGSYQYEAIDAQTYADWGVDYLKYDYCATEEIKISVRDNYQRMRDALNATGRPILYSLCSWGMGNPHEWGKNVAHQWRTGIDVFAAWDKLHRDTLGLPDFLQSILSAVDNQDALHSFAGPGGFNDPDMLVVGLDGMYPYGIVQQCPHHVKGCKPGDYISRERWGKVGGLTKTQQRSHFSLWCMLSSPLILGNDPRHMDKHTLSLLTAQEVIAINQDRLGKQAQRTWRSGGLEAWAKELSGNRAAVMLLNRGLKVAESVTTTFVREVPLMADHWAREVPVVEAPCVDKASECKQWAAKGECVKNPGFMMGQCQASCPGGCPPPPTPPGPVATALVRDAWMEENLGAHVGAFTVRNLGPHECRVLVLTFVEPSDAEKEQDDPQHVNVKQEGEGEGEDTRRSLRDGPAERSDTSKDQQTSGGGWCVSTGMLVSWVTCQAALSLGVALFLRSRSRRVVKVL